MKKNISDIGGEGNGGVILKESHLGRDAFCCFCDYFKSFSK